MTTRVVVVRTTRKVVVRKSGQAGSDGEPGVTPTIVAGTVTTLAPGEEATATLTETAPDTYRLDLGVPAGADGSDGAGIVSSVVAPLAVDGAGALSVDLTGVTTEEELAAAVAGLVSDTDGRLTDARTPTEHADSHGEAGADPVTVTQAQVTGLATALAALLVAADLPTAVAGLAVTDFPAGLARDSEVAAAVAALVNAAPGTLDTLAELAAAIGDDPNFATTLATSLAGKVDKATLDANSLLKADTDDTPSALAVAASTLVGRGAAGGISALTVAQVKTLLALAGADITDATTAGLALLTAATAAAQRTALALTPGTDIYSKAAVDSGFQPLDSDLTAIAALSTTTFGRALLALADAAAARTALGLGTAAVVNTGTASGDVPLLSTGGRLPIARVASGTPDGTKFVRDDGTLAVPAGGGGGASATLLRGVLPFQSGRWYESQVSTEYGTAAATSGVVYYNPLWLVADATLDRIAVNVTTLVAGSTINFGLYADDGTGKPGALIADYGSVASNTAGARTLTISQAVPAGLVWLAALALGGTPTVSAQLVTDADSYPNGFTAAFDASGALGWVDLGLAALPATAAPTSYGTNRPRIQVRAA